MAEAVWTWELMAMSDEGVCQGRGAELWEETHVELREAATVAMLKSTIDST